MVNDRPVSNDKAVTNKKRNPNKPKITKEERRAKYTEIARNRRQKQAGIRGNFQGGNSNGSSKNIVCYQCRQPGHTVADCPSKEQGADREQQAGVLCYKCGSTEHALAACPKRNSGQRDDLPFASCFLCKGKGHLVSACPQNQKGIYVNGGSCRYCGSQQHLATECPDKRKKKSDKASDDVEEVDVEDLLEEEPKPKKASTKQETLETIPKKRRVVKF
jgi:zinc finger CCHC domain-containing protein 9